MLNVKKIRVTFLFASFVIYTTYQVTCDIKDISLDNSNYVS